MRESFRPMLRLALFGTYTIVAIGLSEIRTRLRQSRFRVPKEPPARKSRRRSA
ncbi:MAG: hypothetical protein JWO86_2187 [Myxococcaceae bacterium]|jgi:hypothetical protein|nr:hypothetical protein [Myxococcaceae bacterium]MEA2747973.1 hypothetical protein [Myxococcales bacterium]